MVSYTALLRIALVGVLIVGCSDPSGPSKHPEIRITGDLQYTAGAKDIVGQQFNDG